MTNEVAAKRIQVFGTGCAACTALKASTEKAVAELGLPVSVEFESRILKMVELGIVELPALVVDGKVMSTGRALDVTAVKAMLGDG
jgi:small redox-active disulfide protein 2